MANEKLINIDGLSRYHENLKVVLGAKQDVIEDLQTIREGAAAGATALQAVPEEYVTETELTGKVMLQQHKWTQNKILLLTWKLFVQVLLLVLLRFKQFQRSM